MLDALKNHVIGYSIFLIVSTVGITASAIQFLVISKLERESDFFKGQGSSYQAQVTQLQQTITHMDISCDKRTNDRLNGLKGLCAQKEKFLEDAIGDLKTKLVDEESSVKNCSGYANLSLRLNEIKKQELIASRELKKYLDRLFEKKSKYGYERKECEKSERGGNICEHASARGLEVEALEEAISAKRDFLNNLSGQFIALNKIISANNVK